MKSVSWGAVADSKGMDRSLFHVWSRLFCLRRRGLGWNDFELNLGVCVKSVGLTPVRT